MRALVSGGAGFIGSHLVDALVARGDRVLILDDLSGGRRSNIADALASGAELTEGDITDQAFIRERFSSFEPEQIFHLAAQVDVRKAVADPRFDATVNVLGTINLLEAARQLPRPALVLASTGGAIYGEGAERGLPFSEAAETAPEAAYGASKLAAEVYVGLYRRLYGLPAVALRFGNVYGPRQDPHGEAGVVAIFCGLLRRNEPLVVFGDGRQTRDYVFVLDVVEGLLAAADGLGRDGTRLVGPYNVGTGDETSVIELAGLLAGVAGIEARTEHRPERAGEIQRVAIDPAAAARDLSWRPSTDLVAGLERTFAALEVDARNGE